MNYPAIDEEAVSLFDRPNMTGTPERRLLLAILERALLDYVGNDEREYDEATEWIFSAEPVESPSDFSFPWICSQLDLDLESVRNKIRQMPRRGASRIAPWYLTKGYLAKGHKQPSINKNSEKLGKVLNFSNKKQRTFVY